MADNVRKVNYCHVTVPNRPGQGAKLLGGLRDAQINMLAYSGFPAGNGKAQIDIVVENLAPVRAIARKQGWRVSSPKKGFLVQGKDRAGAVQRHLQRLADARINVVAADALCAGKGRWGMVLWVKPRDYARAARALGA